MRLRLTVEVSYRAGESFLVLAKPLLRSGTRRRDARRVPRGRGVSGSVFQERVPLLRRWDRRSEPVGAGPVGLTRSVTPYPGEGPRLRDYR